MVLLKNAVDTFTNEAAPTKNYNVKARLQVLAGTNVRRYSYVFFTRPWPPGCTIISAKLRLYNGTVMSGSTTITIQRVSAKWGINRVNWNNQPGVTGATTTLVKSSPAVGTEWEFDVAALVQAVADGNAWYGFRISTNNTGVGWFHSQQSATGRYRPVLEVTWSVPPEAPEGLSPAGGRATSLAKPIVRSNYVDADGENTMASMQVQIDAANNFSSGIDFDSGEVATTIPQVDLNATAYAGLAVDATTYWRCRVKDSAGVWSAWSLSESFIRKSKGVLTITSPAAPANNYLWDGSPTITWTFTGTTQRAYQVIIAKDDDANNWLWDSGKITDTVTSVNVPFGAIKSAVGTYRVTVRIWDTIEREGTPNDQVYVEASRAWTFNYDSAVPEVTSLVATSDSVIPKMVLTWNRAAQPTHWQIQRSLDGTNWEYIDEATGAELFVSGTSYRYDDVGAPSYKTHYWRVLAVAAGVQSGDNPTATGQIRRLAPTILQLDGTKPIVLVNAALAKQNLDVQVPVEPIGDFPPVILTQRIGGNAGHIEGTLADNILSGVTAEMMAGYLEEIRKAAGVPVYFANLNETRKVVLYNINSDPVGGVGGIVYRVSMDWVIAE